MAEQQREQRHTIFITGAASGLAGPRQEHLSCEDGSSGATT